MKSSTTFKQDIVLTGFMPHMHVRGKDFKYTLVMPDGKQKVLLSVPKYDFNWQLSYDLEKPIASPTSTIRLTTNTIPIQPKKFVGAIKPGKR